MRKREITNSSRNYFIIGITFLVISVSLGIYVAVIVSRITKFGLINNKLNELHIAINQSTVSVKEFLLNAYTDEDFVKTGSNNSFKSFNKLLYRSIVHLDAIGVSWFIDSQEKKNKIVILSKSLNSYRDNLNQLALLFKQKGFKDLGYEGQMRKAIHFIEKYPLGTNVEYLLSLRRHEKDFLLRKDLKYVEKFDEDFVKFCKWIYENKNYSKGNLKEILTVMQEYKIQFHNIVEIEKLIGLTSGQGIRDKINSDYKTVGLELSELSNEAKNEQMQLTNYVWFVNMALVLVFGLLIFAAIWCVMYFKREVTKPIEELNKAADQIAKGHLSVNLNQLYSKVLVSDITFGFEKLIDKLRQTIAQIEDISSRKTIQNIELNSEHDEIGLSLNKIIQQTISYDLEEFHRNWSTQGYAKFSEIIRNSSEIKELATNMTINLVKYLGANQAGMFVIENINEKPQLVLKAAYAYDKKKFLTKTIEIGEGLVGQCYLENESIFLTDIPQGYLHITSGLGYANPTCLVLIPIKLNDKTEGVFEIASFKKFETYQIIFLEKIAETIASSISSLRLNEITNTLLINSKKQTEEMRAQEEEMRQNLEELASTQEESIRNEQMYLDKINSLEINVATISVALSQAVARNQQLEKSLITFDSKLNVVQLKNNSNYKYSRRIEYFLDN